MKPINPSICTVAQDHRLRCSTPPAGRIHPFLDGNGRIARLFSYAWLCELNVGSSLWSVARGLARQVDEYKASLQAADEPPRWYCYYRRR
ncbi:Fic family protein [Mesorhizobium dulcispinae]|uniref:Fic family protein n=1 Tax=Mesorhizobium dulcispinae TaxID=3072316 RepID=UPI003D31DE92